MILDCGELHLTRRSILLITERFAVRGVDRKNRFLDRPKTNLIRPTLALHGPPGSPRHAGEFEYLNSPAGGASKPDYRRCGREYRSQLMQSLQRHATDQGIVSH